MKVQPAREHSAEDLYGLPDDGNRHELVAGLLVAEPPPMPRHGAIQVLISRLLGDFVEAHDLGVVFTESGFVLARGPDTVRGPDVAFVCRERVDRADLDRFFEGSPDLAVEILSSDDSPGEVLAKVAEYLKAECRMVWVMDPVARQVFVYRSLSPRVLGPEDDLDGEDVLTGFRARVSELFRI